MKCVRELTEQYEANVLSKNATLSVNTRGREFKDEKCTYRTEFQRDRDRIIHSKAFRRLMHKTQVFIAPDGDHYRTRLTHTLEVSQIARTISRSLSLNEDLTEAIALGHDLGHTPFGHTGENILDKICIHGFKHYEQSLRVVEKLEGSKGLNLTCEVRNGILNHSGDNVADTMEGRIIKFADRIAYLNHDIDDAIRANLLNPYDLPQSVAEVFGNSHSTRINTMIDDLIKCSEAKGDICMSQAGGKALMELREFMFAKIYTDSPAKSEEKKAEKVIEALYNYFLKNPSTMPEEYTKIIRETDIHRAVCDYVSGMTDRYAITRYKELFIPKAWQEI